MRTAFIIVLVAQAIVAPWSQAAVPVVFNFLDGPGVGFFNTAPLNDPDLPTATTIGEARRIVVQAAGDHLGSFFQPTYSGEQWIVDAMFFSSGPNGFLASAGPVGGGNGNTFAGGTSGVWYPASLANHLASSTVFSGAVVEAEFNSDIDWDYDLTGSPAVDEESLFSTSVHEIFHGLGFLSDIEESGNYFDGIPSIFDTLLVEGTTPVDSLSTSGRANALVSNNLFFVGAGAMAANPLGAGPVKIHAPSLFEQGSTGSHLDRAAFANIGDPMLPEASSNVPEPIFLSGLDVAIMADLGYTLANSNPPGDFNADGTVDVADYTVWRDGHGSATDYTLWKNNFGLSAPAASFSGNSAVPETATIWLCAMMVFGVAIFRVLQGGVLRRTPASGS
ncbi:MAG: hypothetical protein ACR2NU_08605 [Aeoliella sp.]